MSNVLFEMKNKITTQIMYYKSEGKSANILPCSKSSNLCKENDEFFTVTDTLNIFHIVQILSGKLENDRWCYLIYHSEVAIILFEMLIFHCFIVSQPVLWHFSFKFTDIIVRYVCQKHDVPNLICILKVIQPLSFLNMKHFYFFK